MAISISQSPNLYTPSDNPIVWTFSSNQTAQPNFSYLVELYIDGIIDSRHLVFPEQGAYAHFDASESVMGYVSVAAVDASTLVQDASNTTSVYIIVYEYYGAVPALYLSATASTRYAYKASLSVDEFYTYDYTDYTVGSIASLFLTDSSRDFFTIRQNFTLQLAIITNLQSLTLRIRYYNSSNTLIFTQTAAIANTIKIAQFCLNSAVNLSGINFPNSTYLIIDVLSGATPYSEEITAQIIFDDECDVNTTCSWLNKFGAYDTYTFRHNLINRTNITGLSYNRAIGNWLASTYYLNPTFSGERAFLKQMTDGGDIVSSWVKASEQAVIVPMYESPLTYIEELGRNYSLIYIENTAYLEDQDRFEDMVTEVVTFRYANKRLSPRV